MTDDASVPSPPLTNVAKMTLPDGGENEFDAGVALVDALKIGVDASGVGNATAQYPVASTARQIHFAAVAL